MPAYTRHWLFTNGRTMERFKIYANDRSAVAGTLQSFRRSNPELGEVVRLWSEEAADEIACFRAGDVKAGHVLGTTLKLT